MRRRFAAMKQTDQQVHIDMAPLIDMVFLLLIFYVVTTSFIRATGVDIDAPASDRAIALDGSWLSVAIDATGVVFVNNASISAGDTSAIAQAIDQSGQTAVLIQADKRAPTGVLLRVLDSCKAAGASHVQVAAEHP